MTEVDDLFRTLTKTSSPIKEKHPNFDTYPKYLQDAIIANERLQGRYTKETK